MKDITITGLKEIGFVETPLFVPRELCLNIVEGKVELYVTFHPDETPSLVELVVKHKDGEEESCLYLDGCKSIEDIKTLIRLITNV